MKRIFYTVVLLLCSILVYATSTEKLRLLNLLKQTDSYIASGNFEKASELCEQSLVLFKALGANNDNETISELHKITRAYSKREMYSEAVKTESVLVEVFPIALPDSTLEYAMCMNDLSLYLLKMNDVVLAEKTINKALSLIKDENDNNAAIIYFRAAEIYKELNPSKIDLSIKYQKKAVDIYAKIYGDASPEYLNELTYLAYYYETKEDFENASNSYLEVAKKNIVKVDDEAGLEELLPILDRIIYCSRKANMEEREKKIKEIALMMVNKHEYHRAKYPSTRFPSLKDSLDYLAISQQMASFDNQISKLKDKGDEVGVRTLQKEQNQYLKGLPNTYAKGYFISINALIYHLRLRYRESFEYGTQALQIYDELGIKNDIYVTILCCLSEALYELNKPAKAYEYILRAYELRDDYLSSDSYYYYGILDNLYLFCKYLGNSQDAIKYALEAEKAKAYLIYTNNSEEYFYSAFNVASLFGEIGHYDIELKKLEQLIQRVEEVEPSILEFPENPYLYKLARSYYSNAVYEKALEIGYRVKELYEKSGVEKLQSKIYMLLANIYRKMGDLKESLRYARQAYNIRKNYEEDDGYSLSITYSLLARIYREMGDYKTAEKMKRNAIDLNYNDIIHNFIDLSSDDRTSYWMKLSSEFNKSYPNYFYQAKIGDASELYNKSALFAKGILLNTDQEMSKLISESGDEKALAKYQEFLMNRTILSNMTHLKNAPQNISIDSLRAETSKMERELIRDCKAIGDFTAYLRTSWQDVQTALYPNDVAIEFLSFPLIDKESNYLSKTLYVALILRKKDKNPLFVPLFEEAELDKIDKGNLYGKDLYGLIWGKLDKYLSGISNVYFSPAGRLYNINIEALSEIVGINSDKNFYRVSSTRELVHSIKSNKINTENAIIYGGLKYDASVSSLVANKIIYNENRGTYYRGEVDSLDLRYGWKYLPGTLIEAKAIESTLNDNKIPLQIYTDTLGTEMSFKSHNGKACRILHIATHGFYYTESDSLKMKKARLDYLANQIDKRSRSYVEDCSLTRSGLLMAGCNHILLGEKLPKDLDDGILFSKEIAGMNMKNVELITLSSCDSGLGDVTGEGVFGLQRAFKKAGAQSILMALWKVDDNATRILMTCFYDNYLSRKMSKTESLKEAQRYVRTYQDGIFADPKYWASFVLLDAIGD